MSRVSSNHISILIFDINVRIAFANKFKPLIRNTVIGLRCSIYDLTHLVDEGVRQIKCSTMFFVYAFEIENKKINF